MISKNNIRINATLSRETHAALQAICDESGLTMSYIIETLLKEFCAEYNKPKPERRKRSRKPAVIKELLSL